jgi:hypothetical protein
MWTVYRILISLKGIRIISIGSDVRPELARLVTLCHSLVNMM